MKGTSPFRPYLPKDVIAGEHYTLPLGDGTILAAMLDEEGVAHLSVQTDTDFFVVSMPPATSPRVRQAIILMCAAIRRDSQGIWEGPEAMPRNPENQT